jgi:hypothetical protein
MSDAISAHGTIVWRQPSGSGAFSAIAELRDITPPALSRNAIETTNQNDSDDSYVVGIRRRGDMTFNLGFLPSGASHGISAGLMKSWQDGLKDGWKVVFPDSSVWIFSGYITNIGPSAPVDDGLVADVTIRPTGAMSFS